MFRQLNIKSDYSEDQYRCVQRGATSTLLLTPPPYSLSCSVAIDSSHPDYKRRVAEAERIGREVASKEKTCVLSPRALTHFTAPPPPPLAGKNRTSPSRTRKCLAMCSAALPGRA